MSLNFKSRLMAVIALSTLMVACDEAGKTPGPATELASPSTPQSVSQAEAETALAAFGLDTPGRISWSDRRFEEGRYLFSDVVLTDADGQLIAEQMILDGPRLVDGNPLFNVLMLENADVRWPDGEIAFDQLSLSAPSPALAIDTARLMRGEDSFAALDPDANGHGFGAFAVSGLKVRQVQNKGQTSQLSIEQLQAESLTPNQTLAALSLEQFSFSDPNGEAGPVGLNIAEMELTNLRLSGLDSDNAFGTMLAQPDTVPFERLNLNGVDLTSSGVRITLADMNALIETLQDGVLRSSMALSELTVSSDSDHPESVELQSVLDMMGYDALTFSFQGESQFDPQADRSWTVGENALTLHDGFTIRTEQDLTGLLAYAALMQDSAKEGATPDPLQALAPLEISRFMLEVEDQSFLRRAIEAYAQQNGVAPELAQRQASSMMVLGLAFAGAQLPAGLADEASLAVGAFLDQGGTLTIDLAPESPVSMSVLSQTPLPSTEELGLSVRHTAPREP